MPSLVPTLVPTVVPSWKPTEQVNSVLVLTSFLVLQNIARNLTDVEQLVVRQAQALIMNTSVGQVQYIRTTFATPTGRFNRLRSQSVVVVIAQTETSLPLIDYPSLQNDALALYQQVTAILIDACTTSVFQDTLHEQAQQWNATDLLLVNSTVTNITFSAPLVQMPPSRQPTSMPRYDDGLTTAVLAGMVIACVGGAAVMMLVVHHIISSRRKHASRLAVDGLMVSWTRSTPSKYDLFMDGALHHSAHSEHSVSTSVGIVVDLENPDSCV